MRSKKIYINGRFLLKNNLDGITRFSLEMCKELKRQDVNFHVLVPRGAIISNDQGFNISYFGYFRSHLWEQLSLPIFLLMKNRPLLINFSGVGPILYRNQIVTVHDISYIVNPKWFSRVFGLFYRTIVPIVVRSAKRILTVSDFSKKEIIRYLGVDEDKISVIYNAVSKKIDLEHQNRISEKVLKISETKYILGVFTIDPRKNIERLIEAYSNLNLTDCNLVLVGSTSKNFRIDLKVSNPKIFLTGFLSDQELSFLYKNCQLFIYPSLYEGFGIPPLEAMANGAPVIASSIPSLREIYENACLYVDPYSIDSISKGLSRVLSDSDLRFKLIAEGSKQVLKFNWEKSALQLKSIINKFFKSEEYE